MSPSHHPNLLSAFLAGKSCATIARTFNLSVEEVLTWFESDLTQSTLRRLEALQLQQARIVSFSVLPHAAGSLTNTCESADNPALRTRAASNLVRLGLRFTAASRNSRVPSPMGARVGGGFNSRADLTGQTSRIEETLAPMGAIPDTEFDPLSDEFPPDDFEALTDEALTNEAVTDEDEFNETNAPQTDDPEADFSPLAGLADTANETHSYNAPDPSDPFVPSDPSDSSDSSVPPSPPTLPRHKLACEILRDEYAALRAASSIASPPSPAARISQFAARKAPLINDAPPPRAPRTAKARTPIDHSASANTFTNNHTPLREPAPPLLSRRESPISSLRAAAGAIASLESSTLRGRAPPPSPSRFPLHSAA